VRRGILLLFVVGSVLWVAGPAQAKGAEGGVTAESVSITGPAGSVSLTGTSAAAYGDLSNAFNPSSRMASKPVNVALGPRYDVVYSLTCDLPAGGSTTVAIHQSLYPYARYRSLAQVWTFTAAGQPACGWVEAPAAGWVASRRGLFDVLTAGGLPEALPAPAPAQPLAPLGDGPSAAWYAVVIIGGLLTLLLVALLTRHRVRARASL
jgi:hypothetical protein